jgi:signal transduction histidine kinase
LTLWTGFVSLQVIATAAGNEFFVPYVSAVVVFALWFTTARFVWQKSSTRLPAVARALVFSVLMLATPLVANPLLERGFGLDFFNTRVVISAALYFFVMAWSLALVIAVAGLLRKTNRELIDATSQLRRRVITDNVAARHFEQAVSQVLHGPIQDAIAASLKRIESLPSDALSAGSEGDIIRQHIEEALQLLEGSPSRHYSVDQAISELSALWSGVVEINCQCDETTATALNQAQTTSSIVIEVIREAISNAIRHGDATRINIDVELAEPESEVHISITNNGAPLPKQLRPGIGTQLLKDMTLSWSRRNLAEHVVLTAVVPLHAT